MRRGLPQCLVRTALFLLLAALVAACSSEDTPARGDAPPVETATAAPPTAPAAADTATPVTTVDVGFMGVAFVYDQTLYGATANAQHVKTLPPILDARPGFPENIRFVFSDSADSAPAADGFTPLTPQVGIFPADHYALLSAEAALQIERLRHMLEERPHDVAEPLPLLPEAQGQHELFHTRPHYLEFENGRGLRFVTEYAPEHKPISGEGMFYAFQGLTSDGDFYVTAFFPVTAETMPGGGEQGSSAVLENGEAWQAYRETMALSLSEMAPDAFAPDLTQLDALIASLRVRPEARFPASFGAAHTIFNGVMLSYDDALATTVTAEKIPAQMQTADHATELLSGVPDFIRLTVAHDHANGPWPTTLTIEPVRDAGGNFYASIPEARREHIAALETAGAEPAGLSDGQVTVKEKAVAFQNGTGWRAVTQLTASLVPEKLTNQNLYYTFAGVTADGRYYVQLTYDIDAPLLEAEGSLSDEEVRTALEQGDGFRSAALAPLAALPDSEFTPDLARLDALVASLIIAPDASTESSVPVNEPGCSNAAEFVTDVNVPDNTIVERDAIFTKTWRLRNSGTCTWTPSYGLTAVDGDALEVLEAATMPVVPPGDEIDLSATLRAPQEPGTYQTWWQLQADNGVAFGPRFYLLIETPQPATTLDGYGVIEGSLGYPAGGLPPMTIYFLRTDGSERYALQTEEGWNRYRNELPIGDYYVFARVSGDESNFGGGYTNAVLCGLSAQCKDHALVTVAVEQGKTARDVDVTDWYAPAGTFPIP